MIQNEPVSYIMSENLSVIDSSELVMDAQDLMLKRGIAHLPVVEGEKLVGIISATDLLKHNQMLALEGETEEELIVSDIMISNVTSITPDDNIKYAASILAEGNFHALPVIDERDYIIGIVTSTDLIQYLYDKC